MYVTGGIGVFVTATVGTTVEGTSVLVAVNVTVGVTVGVATWPVPCKTRKIIAAPKARISTINPRAAGRLNFNSGRWGLSTGFDWVGLVEVGTEKLRPQTRQRVAFSLNRVPQVGQTLVFEFVFSGLIIGFYSLESRIITQRIVDLFYPSLYDCSMLFFNIDA